MRLFIDSLVKRWHPTLLGAVVLASLLHFGLPSAQPGRPALADKRISSLDCEKAEIGMFTDDVQRVLGSLGEDVESIEKTADREFQKHWHGDEFDLYVSFDANRRATKVERRSIDPWNRGDHPCN
jgi:hypothetical protein